MCLLLARLFKLGFLADFLSQTVLVGFLTGVGFQVGIAMLGDMLGVSVATHRTVEQLGQVLRNLPEVHVPTLFMSGIVVATILILRRLSPRLPGPLFAVVGAVAASAAFDFAVPRQSAVIGHSAVLGIRAINEFRFQYGFAKYEVSPPFSHGNWAAGDFAARLPRCSSRQSSRP